MLIKNKIYRKSAIIAGLLIIFAYSVLVSTLTNSKILVLTFESLSGVAVIITAFLFFPVFKPHNEKISWAYLGLKSLEGLFIIIPAFMFLSDQSSLLNIRKLITLYHAFLFIGARILFYFLFYQSKVIPRFISIWGFFALASLLIINLLEIQGIGFSILSILYIPIVLNELFLAFWLIFKGFNQPAIISP